METTKTVLEFMRDCANFRRHLQEARRLNSEEATAVKGELETLLDDLKLNLKRRLKT